MSSNIQELQKAYPAIFAKDSMEREYYVFITSNEQIIRLNIIDAETQQHNQTINGNNGKELIDLIPNLFPKHFKAVILDIFNFKNHGYSNNYEFCKIIREKLCRLGVVHHFIPSQQLTPSLIFMASNFVATIGNYIFIITEENYIFTIGGFEFTKNGYEKYSCHEITFSQVTRELICQGKNPAAIIGLNITPLGTSILNTLLKSDNLIMVDPKSLNNTSARFKCICETAKWLKNKKFNKFHVTAMTTKMYYVVGQIGDVHSEIVGVNVETKLPAKKSMVVPKMFQSYYIKSGCNENFDILETTKIYKMCHKIEVTLKIDDQHFYSLTTKNIIIPEIQNLPKKLDAIQKSKIPVIGFWDNSSVICISKNSGKYKFLKSWNGLYGNELFIIFNKKRPTFDSKLLELNTIKMDTVVYDILKIMSMPFDDIKIDKKWKFTFTNDDENPILLEFENFDGEKSAASPAFLMAMILRQHFKAIEAEIGEKPKEIGICLFDDFTDDERNRVESQLQESCKLLEVKCTFVKI